MIGAFAFIVFAVASIAQLVVGSLLDRFGARPVFMGAAAVQVVFFAIMPGLVDALALAVALGFMLGAFGQIPINDYMIGKLAAGEFRARVYGVRYVVSFTALAASLPLIAFVYERLGIRHVVPLSGGNGARHFRDGRLPAAHVAGAGAGARPCGVITILLARRLRSATSRLTLSRRALWLLITLSMSRCSSSPTRCSRGLSCALR